MSKTPWPLDQLSLLYSAYNASTCWPHWAPRAPAILTVVRFLRLIPLSPVLKTMPLSLTLHREASPNPRTRCATSLQWHRNRLPFCILTFVTFVIFFFQDSSPWGLWSVKSRVSEPAFLSYRIFKKILVKSRSKWINKHGKKVVWCHGGRHVW